MTGVGGNSGLSAALNAKAKSFPDGTRASATGTVLAGFGLSAFLFSTVGHAAFQGRRGWAGLLLLLALGTGLPAIVGSFIIRPVPPQSTSTTHGYEPIAAGPEIVVDRSRVSLDQAPYSRSSSLEMSRSRSPASRHRHPAQPLDTEHSGGDSDIAFTKPFDSEITAVAPNFTPRELLRSKDFYTLFTVLALCCGTGLMYINNAGTVALALGRMGKLVYDTERVAAYQAKQVATVSIWNCTGRIAGGLVSDAARIKLGIKRVSPTLTITWWCSSDWQIWFLPVVAFLFVVSQLTALKRHVRRASVSCRHCSARLRQLVQRSTSYAWFSNGSACVSLVISHPQEGGSDKL